VVDAMVLLASRGWQTQPMDDEVEALVAEQVAYYDIAYLGKDWDHSICVGLAAATPLRHGVLRLGATW
jgi:hypothetical protein